MLTECEAYLAMFRFLEEHWERNGRPDELGALLGSMAVLDDGRPADAAAWDEWLDAVNFTRRQARTEKRGGGN